MCSEAQNIVQALQARWLAFKANIEVIISVGSDNVAENTGDRG
jgi:hypothetical protein